MRTKWAYTVLVGSALLAALATARPPAWAGNNGKPQDGQGKYSALSGAWWSWALSQPTVDVPGTNTNPVLDATGEYATSGQTNGIGPGNKFFFLAGTFGATVVRNVTVPKGKQLFFPVLNVEWDNAFDPPTTNTVPQLRAIAKANIDLMTVAVAKVDGVPIEVFRTTSPTFSYTMPEVNSLYAYFGLFGPQFEGTIKPVVSDGYWAYAGVLSPGAHTVYIRGETSNGFVTDVTYHLTVL